MSVYRYVRILQPAEPEPDEAAVEALADAIYDHEYDQVAGLCKCGTDTDGDHARHVARVLAVVSTDA